MGSGPDDRPLPYGWIQQHDPASDHVFYVDSKATPPRAIWVHPYEDEQYLSEHPDVREKVQTDSKAAPASPSNDELPPYQKEASSSAYDQAKTPEKATEFESASSPLASNEGETSHGKQKKRGVFGKMKDAALGGTKEERDAARKRDQEWAAARKQEQNQQMAYYSQHAAPGYGSGSYQPGPHVAAYPGAAAHYGPRPPPHFVQQVAYGPGPGPIPGPSYNPQYAPQPGPYPHQAPYPPPGPYPPQVPYGAPYYAPPPPNIVYAQQPSRSGSSALPIAGGLAGGLLLGSLMW